MTDLVRGDGARSADMLGNLVVAVVADAAPERDILCRLMRAETVVYELLDQRVIVRVAAMNRHCDAETVSGSRWQVADLEPAEDGEGLGVVVDQTADRVGREHRDLVVERAEPGGVGVELVLGVADEDRVDVLLFR